MPAKEARTPESDLKSAFRNLKSHQIENQTLEIINPRPCLESVAMFPVNRWSIVSALNCLALFASCASGAAPASVLDTIRNVQSDGTGNVEAARAWRQLVQSDAAKLTDVLAALDGAGPLARNWLRSAVDAIAERTLEAGQPLGTQQLQRFVLNQKHDARARRLAYEWLIRADKTAADRLIPGMLHDPSVEFRRDAVARLLDQADTRLQAKENAAATDLLQQALSGARDDDQIKVIVKQLRALGQSVNLPRHFGFLMQWQIIGPFDNTQRKGFAEAFPPERGFESDAKYPGKSGVVTWVSHTTKDEYGMVDLNEPLGKLKETVAYARTEFVSDREQPVEFRLGCKNAWKLWVNGELLFGRDEYHRGMRLDQYRMLATLRRGKNRILLKICQNEQTESWTVEWQFQLRVCDTTGTAILSAARPSGSTGAD